MAATEDRLVEILAETVSELRLLRRELASAVEALPPARRPEPRSTPSPEPAGTATAVPRAQAVAPQAEQTLTSRPNPTRLSAEAFQKPHKPLAPRAPADGPAEPRAYAWETTVTSIEARPTS
jgi:hypothetical protein